MTKGLLVWVSSGYSLATLRLFPTSSGDVGNLQACLLWSYTLPDSSVRFISSDEKFIVSTFFSWQILFLLENFFLFFFETKRTRRIFINFWHRHRHEPKLIIKQPLTTIRLLRQEAVAKVIYHQVVLDRAVVMVFCIVYWTHDGK